MFVLTAKLSKPKLIAAGVILLATLLLIILLAMSGGDVLSQEDPLGGTNEERLAYLATFGWSVNAQPKEAQTVHIPDTAENEVFARYNDLQKSQGFDLQDFAGKDAMRYVYEVLNYPEAKEPVLASVLVYEGKIIGGDVTNTAPDGLIHGFAMPSQSIPESSEIPTTEAVPESSEESTQESSSEAS